MNGVSGCSGLKETGVTSSVIGVVSKSLGGNYVGFSKG